MEIIFSNPVQVALYEEELKGQISDGMWENSTPHDHYKVMCNAKARVAAPGERTGCVGFWPKRYYGFSSKFLYECVGDRMLEIARKVPGHENITDKEVKRQLREMSRIVNQGFRR